MAVQHKNAHARPENEDPRIHGPYLDDIRAQQEVARREARQKARQITGKHVAEPVAEENSEEEDSNVESDAE